MFYLETALNTTDGPMSREVLVVGDKVYKLAGNTADLEKIGVGKATVTGTAKDDTIDVQSVAAAK